MAENENKTGNKSQSHYNGFDKSHQLLRSTHKPRSRTRRSMRKGRKNILGYVCGKPMPSLTELEKMYADSDEETSGAAEEIPSKKYKKPYMPYIVGCTERAYIPEKSNCNVFKGTPYGINTKSNALSDYQDNIKTSGLNLNGCTLSHSIFNAEINGLASNVLSNTSNQIVCDSDSDGTVIYELDSPISRFSPEPSTSKDSQTIAKNDQNFIESFLVPRKGYCKEENKIEPVGVTMVSEDDLSNIDVHKQDVNYTEEVNSCPKWIPKNNTNFELIANSDTSPLSYYESFGDEIENNEKSCDIFTNTTDTSIKMSTKIKDELFTNDFAVITKGHHPLTAVIDLTNIDDVIAENQSIIDKYSELNNLSTVNKVETKNDEPLRSTDEGVSKMQWSLNNAVNSSIQRKNEALNQNNLCYNHNNDSRQLFLGTCPICWDDLSKEMVVSTTCGHLFCKPCIKAALFKCKPKKCPKCRAKLSGLGYHPIYTL